MKDKKPHTLNIRLSDKEFNFITSFEPNKTRTDIVRRALELYMQRVSSINRFKEAVKGD